MFLFVRRLFHLRSQTWQATQTQFTVISCLRIAIDADVSVQSTLRSRWLCEPFQNGKWLMNGWHTMRSRYTFIHKTNVVEYVCGFHSTMDKC